MRKINCFLVVLALLVTFAGCNQKEKKLEKITEGISQAQWYLINEIAASAFDKNVHPSSSFTYRNDTLMFEIVIDTLTEGKVKQAKNGEKLLKNYLLTALCCENSPVKELFSHIAEAPTPLKLFYGDSSEKEKIIMLVSGTEIRDALAKEYGQRNVLENYFEWLSFYEFDEDEEFNVSSCFEKINEKDYIVVEYASDSMLSYIDEKVNFDIDNAKDNFLIDIDDIVDFDKYKNKISEKYREEIAEYIKEEYVEEGGLFDNKYIPELMQKTNVGLIFRLKDKSSGKPMDVVIESNEFLGEKNSEK